MGSNALNDPEDWGSLPVEIGFTVLNILLLEAYKLGREDENREERGIPLLNLREEFKKVLDKLPKKGYNDI